MENTQIFLNKISQLFNQGIKSKIEQDLILDYTRKFYEQICAIKIENIPFTPITENEEPSQSNVDENIEEEKEVVLPLSTHIIFSGNDLRNTESPLNEDEKKLKESQGEEPQNNEAEASDNDTNLPEKKQNDGGIDHEIAEEEVIQKMLQQQRNISFEPPHPAEETSLFFDEGIEEEQPEDNVNPPQEIPVIAQIKENNTNDYAAIFNFNSNVKNNTASEIRKKIGINDKYLFLNELFHSDKSAYEKTLDDINQMTQLSDAFDWVKENVATKYKWHEDDETVEDFYEVLRKHFADK